MPSALLHLLQRVYVPRIQHHRLLADHVGTKPQTISGVRVVQIVRRTYRDEIYVCATLDETCVMTVKQLLFGKKRRIREIAVHDAHRVTLVIGRHHVVSRVFYRLQMPWRYIPSNSNYRKILHHSYSVVLLFSCSVLTD